MPSAEPMGRRRSDRIKMDDYVVVSSHVIARLLNLSKEGMYIFTRKYILADSIIDLKFSLEGREINIAARVRHSEPGVGCGVSFLFAPGSLKYKHNIESYVTKHAHGLHH